MAILAIARLTLREASRRRLLLAVGLLTIAIALLSDWGFHRLLDLPCGSGSSHHACPASELKFIASTMLILLMFMFSFVLALGAAFIAAPSVSSEIESGVMLAMLPRPIRRSDVVLGKWLGLALIIAAYTLVACGVEFVISNFALNYVPPSPVEVIAFLIAEGLIVLTLTLALSTRLSAMTGGIIVLALFGMAWMGGVVGAVGRAFNSKPIESVSTLTTLLLPTDGLWRGALYHLEPVALLVVGSSGGRRESGNPFFVASPPTNAYLLWSLLWLAVVLSAAVWSFSRREL
jgi:ABC-type transport system involved in multi-copper enzyme maturation permease subunit